MFHSISQQPKTKNKLDKYSHGSSDTRTRNAVHVCIDVPPSSSSSSSPPPLCMCALMCACHYVCTLRIVHVSLRVYIAHCAFILCVASIDDPTTSMCIRAMRPRAACRPCGRLGSRCCPSKSGWTRCGGATDGWRWLKASRACSSLLSCRFRTRRAGSKQLPTALASACSAANIVMMSAGTAPSATNALTGRICCRRSIAGLRTMRSTRCSESIRRRVRCRMASTPRFPALPKSQPLPAWVAVTAAVSA